MNGNGVSGLGSQSGCVGLGKFAISGEPSEVLIVDTNTEHVAMLRAFLETINIASRSFDSFQAFTQYLPTIQGSACAILEISIAEKCGLELQRDLTKEYPNIPVMFLTSCSDVRSAVRAMQSGAIDFIQKPMNSNHLLESVNQMVREAHKRHLKAIEKSKTSNLWARLSPRETEVLNTLMEGNTSRELAKILSISPRTADAHKLNILKKVKMDNFHELTRIFLNSIAA